MQVRPTTSKMFSCRDERLDGRCHSAAPMGGRINLRNLRNDCLALAHALRQHQLQLPCVQPNLVLGLGTEVGWLLQ